MVIPVAAATATMNFTVVEVNPPTVEITAPADNSNYILGNAVYFTFNGEDQLNWRGDPSCLREMCFSISHLYGGIVKPDTYLDLSLGLPQQAVFTPLMSGTYVVTLKGTDTDGIAVTDVIFLHVLNPDDPFSFERLGHPWTSPTAGLTYDYVNKTEGAISLVITNRGNMEITSPEFTTEDFDHLSNVIGLDLFIPTTAVPGPDGYGTLTFYINDYRLGIISLTDLSNRGSWITVQFPVSDGLLRRLKEYHANMSARIVINTQHTGGNYQIDNLRFIGSVSQRLASILQNPPGLNIEPEDFDLGGLYNSYYDSTTENLGGYYRDTGVDIERCNRFPGQTDDYNVGWTQPGEWLQYTINIADPSNYSLHIDYAALNEGAGFHIEIPGVLSTDNIPLAATGGWQTWNNYQLPDFYLPAGEHRLRIVVDSPGFNLDTLYLNKIVRGPFITKNIPEIVEAEYFDKGGEGVAYHDTDYLSLGGYDFHESRVDVINDPITGYAIGYIRDGEWLEYTIASVAGNSFNIDNINLYPSPPPALPSIIVNGDFSTGLDNWDLGTYEGAVALYQITGGAMETVIDWGGNLNWNVQITQSGVVIETGKTYMVRFDAMSDTTRTINMNIGLGGDPYTSYGGDDFSLTTTMTTFTYSFTMNQPTDTNTRFEFNFGADSGNVIIDNVEMVVQ